MVEWSCVNYVLIWILELFENGKMCFTLLCYEVLYFKNTTENFRKKTTYLFQVLPRGISNTIY